MAAIERERGHIDFLFFFTGGDRAKQCEPELVIVIRHISPDELNHPFGGIFLESGYP
jgi:hypothetical protein